MTAVLKITTSLFNYEQILPSLANKGRELFGTHFHLYPEDLKVIIPIIAWMLRDDDVAQQFEIDLKKGIFLSGPVGTGKTQIMKLMRHIAPEPLTHHMMSCRKISNDYAIKGVPALLCYKSTPRIWCFDDMGREDIAHHYGTTCQVMRDIMMERHELFCQEGIFTHATSTLTATEIGNKYGTEVRSRMREMFNRIAFQKDARDKRGIIS